MKSPPRYHEIAGGNACELNNEGIMKRLALSRSGSVRAAFLLALFDLADPTAAQTLVELRVEGPTAIRERMTGRYRATAVFDTGKEFDVTLSSDWWVDPNTYAEFDFPGRLKCVDVPSDQTAQVSATFTWDSVTQSGQVDLTILDSPAEGPDPWPTWGRTTTRIGNTTTVGPQTPRIEWSVQADFYSSSAGIQAGSAMDAFGRLFQGQLRGVTAIDSITHDILWTTDGGDTVASSPSVFENRVFWAVTSSGHLFCSNSETGNELWRFDAPGGYNVSPVADEAGIVYFNDRRANIYGRAASDGSEVWTQLQNSECFCPFALDPDLLIVGGRDADALALVRSDGTAWTPAWVFSTGRELFGTVVLAPENVYIQSRDRHLYSIRRSDGHQMWAFNCEQLSNGATALGADGSIYAGTIGNVHWLFAISPTGAEIWRRSLPGGMYSSPIVAGDGTIYYSCTRFDGNENPAFVEAVRPDGSLLWSIRMPLETRASPMLAPDGTLYVMCSDKFLYAFRDPAGDLNGDKVIDLADYARFDECMTAPRIWGTKSNTIPGCELLDFDRDWDADLADYAAFQNAFGTAIP